METSDFRLTGTGLLYRIPLVRSVGSEWKTAIAMAITWVPLLVLSALGGIAVGHSVDMPFVLDPVPYARFLVGLPLIVGLQGAVRRRLSDVTIYLWNSGIVVDDDRSRFREAFLRLAHNGTSIANDIIFLIVAYLVVLVIGGHSTHDQYSTWYSYDRGAGEQVTPAGWWYSVVSLPTFVYLLLQALWRAVGWGRFLWQISRLDLRLLPSHPDRAGGLGILQVAQMSFMPLVLAISAILAANLANLTFEEGLDLGTEVPVIITYVVLAILFVAGPLGVFARKLNLAKRRGMVEYGDLADDLFRAFDDKWIRRSDVEQRRLLGDTDPSSLADYGYAYEVVSEMRIVPFSRQALVIVIFATVGPFVPLLLLDYSIKELLQGLLGILG